MQNIGQTQVMVFSKRKILSPNPQVNLQVKPFAYEAKTKCHCVIVNQRKINSLQLPENYPNRVTYCTKIKIAKHPMQNVFELQFYTSHADKL